MPASLANPTPCLEKWFFELVKSHSSWRLALTPTLSYGQK